MTIPFRVLLTSVGGAMSPLTIRTLQTSERHRVSVIGVDQSADAIGRHFADVFSVVPNGADPAYAEAVLDVAARHGADLILPCSDEEALALAAIADRVAAAGHLLACAPEGTLRRMSDKAASFRLLGDHGLPVPRWQVAERPDEVRDAVGSVAEASGGEFAVKPAKSRGGRNVYVARFDIDGTEAVNDGRETHCHPRVFRERYLDEVAEMAPVMVMERLQPPAWDIDVLTWQGRVLRSAPRRRINPAGIPFRGGVVEGDARLLALGERVTAALELSWLYDYDIMSDRNGDPRIIELNPRPSGSIAAATAAGVPLLDDLVSLAKGESLPPLPPPATRTVLPYMAVTVVEGEL